MNGNDENGDMEDDVVKTAVAAELKSKKNQGKRRENCVPETAEISEGRGKEDAPLPESLLKTLEEKLAADELEEALSLLAPALDRPEPPIDVLMAAGDIWWRIAIKTGSMESYANTADIFGRVLAQAPEQQALQRRIGYCRLLQAQRETGKRQLDLLNAAVERLTDAAAFESDQDASVLTDLGYAILQRARLIVDDKDKDYALAESAFRAALNAGMAVDSDAAWLLQRVLRLRVVLLPPDEMRACRSEVSEIIANALQKGGNIAQRPLWQASAIQAEREEVKGEALTKARKRVRLKEIRARYRALIRQETPAPIILSWVELLCAEADGLVGMARKEKYIEAEQALMLCARAEQDQDEMELQIMVSRIARWRSRLEPVAMRPALLSMAEETLRPYLEADHANELKMEAAHLALERAPLLDRPHSRACYQRALSLLEPLLEIPAMETEALQCYLTAWLALEQQDEQAMEDSERAGLLQRLLALAPEDGETWLIAAKAALEDGDHEKASACCEFAWHLGISRSALMPIWQQINDDWASAVAIDGRLPVPLIKSKKRQRIAGRKTWS